MTLYLIEDTHKKTNLHSCLRTGPAAGCVGIQDRRGNASDTFTVHDQVAHRGHERSHRRRHIRRCVSGRENDERDICTQTSSNTEDSQHEQDSIGSHRICRRRLNDDRGQQSVWDKEAGAAASHCSFTRHFPMTCLVVLHEDLI